MADKLIPFGEISESFTGLKDKGIYYVDKTGFIPFLLKQSREICVVTRPRRFGKTLMLRTLQTFFEYRLDDAGQPVDNRRYFDGLKVMDAGEGVLKHLGQYPVISISLKGMRNNSLDEMVTKLRNALASACSPHDYLLEHPALSAFEREQFLQIRSKRIAQGDLEEALGNVCAWIYNATKRKTVILLDEYDVPLQQAAIYDMQHPGSDLFENTVKLVGNFISSGFKSNDNLAYGVISGCMRVAKESIFTGMNNPGVIDVLTEDIPTEFWGFTEDEVKQMLDYYGLTDQYSAIEAWYDGYAFGGRKVFNPWSLLNAIRGLVNGLQAESAIQPYWVMTSGNDIIDEVIEQNPEHRADLAKMMSGGTIMAQIYKNLSYWDLKQNPDAIWSFLLYTGYLKALNVYKNEDNILEAELTVPNTEVRTVMLASMKHWWKDIFMRSCPVDRLGDALWDGDIAQVEEIFHDILMDSVSVFDYHENFYHGMLLGLLVRTPFKRVMSNREYGEGRPDIVAFVTPRALVFELKCVTQKRIDKAMKADPHADEEDIIVSQMIAALDEAEQQIDRRRYVKGVKAAFPHAKEIKIYALSFCRKRCMARCIEL